MSNRSYQTGKRVAALFSAVFLMGSLLYVGYVAQAATAARLSGTFNVVQLVTAAQNGDPVGFSETLPYTFTPNCSSGSCATQMTRRHNDGTDLTYAVSPDSAGNYAGSSNYVGSCYNNGAATVQDGQNYTETINITPTGYADGSVSSFTGTLSLSFVPTASGAANGCSGGSETLQLTGTLPTTQPTPLPNLDGGTFIAFWYTSGGAEECTNAFNVIRPNGQRFSLTAKHCIDGNDPNFDQRTNEQVAALQPMDITTVNVGGHTSLTNTLRIATAMDCTPPSSPITPPSTAPIVVGTQLSPGGNCVLPSDNPKPINGDMVAFKPDSPTAVSAEVQTKQGVLPVLDSETIKQVNKNGDELCHWGAGSAGNLKTPEHCGFLRSVVADSAGMYFFKAKGVGGDSGGPVYVYKYNKKGKAVGVYAVGMVLSAGQVCNSIGVCHDEIGFVPLSTILTQLGVTLATSA